MPWPHMVTAIFKPPSPQDAFAKQRRSADLQGSKCHARKLLSLASIKVKRSGVIMSYIAIRFQTICPKEHARKWTWKGDDQELETHTHIVYIQFWGCSINYTDGPNTCQLTFNEVPSSLVVEVQTADDSSCRDRCHTTWQYDIENMHSLNILLRSVIMWWGIDINIPKRWIKCAIHTCDPKEACCWNTWHGQIDAPSQERKIRSPSLTPAPTKLHSSLNSFGLDSGRSMITTTSFTSLLRLNLKSSHEKTWNCQ